MLGIGVASFLSGVVYTYDARDHRADGNTRAYGMVRSSAGEKHCFVAHGGLPMGATIPVYLLPGRIGFPTCKGRDPRWLWGPGAGLSLAMAPLCVFLGLYWLRQAKQPT